MTESEINIRFYDVYRVRTLEVYTQNSNGDWQMAQKESVRVPLK